MLLHRFFFLLVMLMLSFGTANAGKAVQKTKAALVVRNDTARITVRHFNTKALDNYGAQKEFQYKNDGYEGASLWTRFWNWVWSFFNFKEGSSALMTAIQYFLIALGVAALIFLILKLSGVDPLGAIRRKPTAIALPYDESVENIHEMDLDTGIQNSVLQHNYRLAVRLLYLKCLKQLSDAGHIAWDINKTNHTYVNELADAEQRIAFNMLTRQFEYIWYGQFNIDAQSYSRINAMFNDFKIKRA